MSTLIPITPQRFSERASALLSAAPDLPGPELARKLASLRGAWRDLDPAGRAEVKDLAARLSLLSASSGSEEPPPPQLMRIDGEPETAFAAAEEREARRALQGLDGLDLVAEPTRVYDGPIDPDALLAHFGHQGFRPGQREAVQAALAGRDCLTVMPTGGGKSLCYQLPGLATPRLTVVVSPLIALIADQYRRLVDGGHPAVMVASGMGQPAVFSALDRIVDGSARIVFCSPERFAARSFTRALEQREVGLFVVDEAHCVSEWGHDFRPDYLRLHRAIEALGRPTVMAATATATEQVAEEITRRLGLHDPLMIRSGFDRPNLSFDVAALDGEGSKARKSMMLLGGLRDQANRPAIVYAGTRKDVEETVEALRGDGLSAVGYHAGMPADERASAQHRFMAGDAEIVVATNAFGMGVDKADVRSVWHVAIPTSVEAYYQEAGRGGRDGAPARAVLLASRSDLGRLINFIKLGAVETADVLRFFGGLRAAADQVGSSVIELDAPRDDRDRVCLGIAERAGGLRMEFAGSGRLKLTLADSLSATNVASICRVASQRNWEAYRTVKDYASPSDVCRRRMLLDHFSDPRPGAPLGRCCDVCDPGTSGLPDPETLVVVKRRSRARGGGAGAGGLAGPGAGTGAGTGAGAAAAPPELTGADLVLLDALRAWRRDAADGKPAYTVAHNAVLEAIAATRPADAGALGAISGVGPSFIAKYGPAVLALVAAA